MEIEEEEEKEKDDELIKKFSEHKIQKNNNDFENQKKLNRENIFIKCSFDKNSVENNKKILEQYEKSGLIYKQHYYAFDKDELEDPIDQKKIKKDKIIENNLYLFEKDVENSDLYCGYLDNFNLLKVKNKNKSIVSCSYCFNLISNNILDNKTDQGYIIIGKSEYIFKDFASEAMNSKEAKNLFKNNKGIQNYEINNGKEINLENKNFDDEDMKEKIDTNNKILENIEIKEDKKKYIIISCINCGNILGLFNTLNNHKIILDYF